MVRDIEQYTAEYLSLPFEPIQASYRRRRVLAEVARFHPRHILEVGCGHAPLFTDLPGIDFTVVEPSTIFAHGARDLALGQGSVRVIQARLEDYSARLADQDLAFDMVILSCLLHEVEDPQALLGAIRRLCRSETVLHVNVPNARSLHRLLAVGMGLIAEPGARSDTQRRMQQRNTYDMASLHAELQQAGFSPIDQGSLFVKPFTHAQMQRLVDNGFCTPAMLDGFDSLTRQLPDLGSEIWVNAKVVHAPEI